MSCFNVSVAKKSPESFRQALVKRVGREGSIYRSSLSSEVIFNNGRFTFDALVLCRHLAFSFLFLHQQKKYVQVFETEESMRADEKLRTNFYDKSRAQYRADRYLWLNLQDSQSPNSLGAVLYRLFEEISSGGKTKIQLFSEVHAMSFVLNKKPDGTGQFRYSVLFYDPNDTLAHIRFFSKNIEDVKYLSLEDFLGAFLQESYFPKLKSGVFMIYDNPDLLTPEKKESERRVELEGPESPELHYLLYFGISDQFRVEFSKILASPGLDEEKLFARRGDGVSGFCMGVAGNHVETVKNYVALILSSRLETEVKKKLLSANDAHGTPGFYSAFVLGHAQMIRDYVSLILSSRLDIEIKKNLLFLKDAKGTPGFYFTLQFDRPDSVRSYAELILCSELKTEMKKELLLAVDFQGVPGFYFALQLENSETIRVYGELVLASGLDREVKKELLLAKDARGASGLSYAFQFCRTKAINAYLETVLGSELDMCFKKEITLKTIPEIYVDSLKSRFDLINYLLSVKASFISGAWGEEPLLYLVVAQGYLSTAKSLLEKGADPLAGQKPLAMMIEDEKSGPGTGRPTLTLDGEKLAIKHPLIATLLLEKNTIMKVDSRTLRGAWIEGVSRISSAAIRENSEDQMSRRYKRFRFLSEHGENFSYS